MYDFSEEFYAVFININNLLGHKSVSLRKKIDAKPT